MLVSGSAQAPAAGVAGPAQPTEVGFRARVSFDLPSSPSPVDPALGKGLKEDGDSVVSIPQLWTGLSLTLLLSFVPIIRISSSFSTSCSALQVWSFSSGSTPLGQSRPCFHLSPTASLASCSGPSSCWGGEGGLCCVRVTLQVPALYDFCCWLGAIYLVRSYWVLSFILYFLRLLRLLFRSIEVDHYWSPYLALRLCHPWVMIDLFCHFGRLLVTWGSARMPCHFMRLSQLSHQYGWNDYSSIVLGAFFLHAALLAGIVITCCSPIFLFGCAERFRLWFVVRSVGSSIWCPEFNLKFV